MLSLSPSATAGWGNRDPAAAGVEVLGLSAFVNGPVALSHSASAGCAAHAMGGPARARGLRGGRSRSAGRARTPGPIAGGGRRSDGHRVDWVGARGCRRSRSTEYLSASPGDTRRPHGPSCGDTRRRFDAERAAVIVGLRDPPGAALKRRGGGDHLEGRPRRAGALDRPIHQRVVAGGPNRSSNSDWVIAWVNTFGSNVGFEPIA